MTISKRLLPRFVETLACHSLLQYGRATWRDRAVPSFIIIGAQKSGTSSLRYYLRQHPQLRPSLTKEVHFFDGGLRSGRDNFQLGEPWYRAHFPLSTSLGDRGKAFEVSPLYIFNPLVAARMSNMYPEVKIIALLRNPTQRAVSHYFHEKRRCREPLSLAEALNAEEQRLQSVINGGDYRNDTFMHCSYKSRGRYHEQLQRFFEFFPPTQIFILSSEELFADPQRWLKKIFEFVEVDPQYQVSDLKPCNVGENKEEVNATVVEQLDQYFSAHNRALYAGVGRNFGW